MKMHFWRLFALGLIAAPAAGAQAAEALPFHFADFDASNTPDQVMLVRRALAEEIRSGISAKLLETRIEEAGAACAPKRNGTEAVCTYQGRDGFAGDSFAEVDWRIRFQTTTTGDVAGLIVRKYVDLN